MDISKGGILLETPYSMEPGSLVLNATDRNKNSIEVKGKLRYSKATSIGTWLCGIEFIGIDERIRDFITRLIKEYHLDLHIKPQNAPLISNTSCLSQK